MWRTKKEQCYPRLLSQTQTCVPMRARGARAGQRGREACRTRERGRLRSREHALRRSPRCKPASVSRNKQPRIASAREQPRKLRPARRCGMRHGMACQCSVCGSSWSGEWRRQGIGYVGVVLLLGGDRKHIGGNFIRRGRHRPNSNSPHEFEYTAPKKTLCTVQTYHDVVLQRVFVVRRDCSSRGPRQRTVQRPLVSFFLFRFLHGFTTSRRHIDPSEPFEQLCRRAEGVVVESRHPYPKVRH